MGQRYMIFNSAMPTTAAPVKQATGTAIRTMLQLATSSGNPIKVEEWGISFDGTAANMPVQCELVDTATVAATMTTAHVAANIMQLDSVSDGGNSTLSVGATNLTGFATTAVTEGTVTSTRIGDLQMVPPSSLYVKMFPLGREFFVPGGRYLRVRVTASVTVNCYTYIQFSD
jgi:hypothetical protein